MRSQERAMKMFSAWLPYIKETQMGSGKAYKYTLNIFNIPTIKTL